MTEGYPNSASLGEDVPGQQIKAFEDNGRRLFAAAKTRFYIDGRVGVGRTDAKVLDNVRYQTKEGELVTINDSAAALGAGESLAGSIAVTIETPLPWSMETPNAYVYETFIFSGFDRHEGYEYTIGVSEYTLDGDPIAQAHTMDDIRSAYPKTTKPFGSECTPEHFTDQMLTMVQLQPEDEVGCDPNPYYRIHRG